MNKPFVYKPSVGDLIWFSAFKALSKETEKESPADYEYYSKKEFFVKLDLSNGQRSILKTFEVLFNFLNRIGLI